MFQNLTLRHGSADTIDAFVGRLSEISFKSVYFCETIDESKRVKKFLKSLPRKRYIHIIAALVDNEFRNNRIEFYVPEFTICALMKVSYL